MKELANPQAANLQVFYNESENVSIRTKLIRDEVWFVAKDVCMLLDLSNSRDILAKVLDDDEKGVDNIYTLGGRQQMSVINESGLYHLIFVSRKVAKGITQMAKLNRKDGIVYPKEKPVYEQLMINWEEE